MIQLVVRITVAELTLFLEQGCCWLLPDSCCPLTVRYAPQVTSSCISTALVANTMKQVIDKHPVHPEAYMDKAQKAVEDLKNELIVVPMVLLWWISGSMFALAAKSFMTKNLILNEAVQEATWIGVLFTILGQYLYGRACLTPKAQRAAGALMCLFAVLWLHHKPDFHVSSVVHHMKWYADHYRDGGIGPPPPLALSPVSHAPAPATSEDLVPPAFAPSSATSQDFQRRQCVATNASVLLYGAMGRHNLGDMLMPHILEWLLKRHCGYTAGQFHHADVLGQNMSRFGGHNVDSISSFFADGFQTPINVVHCGGEVTSCMLPTAKSFFPATVSVPKGLNEAFGQSPVQTTC